MAYATTALKEQSQLEIIYIDFSGTLQNVNHRPLLFKLLQTSYGIA